LAQTAQIDNAWNLSGAVVINSVQALLSASQALPLTPNTTVNFANVTDIDTAAISLILEWKRRAQRENLPLKFVNLPANLISLMQLYGVAELIN
jgi:phospholipid transport system transporter-binding protein